MEKPIEVPTDATVTFVRSHVPAGAEIIEVGCGAGHVAAQLSRDGYSVVGIDSDPGAVSRARQIGVDAIHACWPNFDCGLVDAVIFTRSLHHLSPLQAAVTKIGKVLKPAGRLLVEDFAFDEAEPSAINWLVDIVGSPKGRGMISRTPDEFVTNLSDADDAERAWREDHDHNLHTASDMALSIEQEFTLCDTQQVPYLYRYLVPVLPETREAATFLQEILAQERLLGARGDISLIGRRWVAKCGETSIQEHR